MKGVREKGKPHIEETRKENEPGGKCLQRTARRDKPRQEICMKDRSKRSLVKRGGEGRIP